MSQKIDASASSCPVALSASVLVPLTWAPLAFIFSLSLKIFKAKQRRQLHLIEHLNCILQAAKQRYIRFIEKGEVDDNDEPLSPTSSESTNSELSQQQPQPESASIEEIVSPNSLSSHQPAAVSSSKSTSKPTTAETYEKHALPSHVSPTMIHKHVNSLVICTENACSRSSSVSSPTAQSNAADLEAIIKYGRPALQVDNDTDEFVVPQDANYKRLMMKSSAKIIEIAKSVGRIDLVKKGWFWNSMEHAGTGTLYKLISSFLTCLLLITVRVFFDLFS